MAAVMAELSADLKAERLAVQTGSLDLKWVVHLVVRWALVWDDVLVKQMVVP